MSVLRVPFKPRDAEVAGVGFRVPPSGPEAREHRSAKNRRQTASMDGVLKGTLRLLPIWSILLLLGGAGTALAQGATCETDKSGARFVAAKLHWLAPGFDFDNNGGSGLDGRGTYSAPTIPTTPVPAQYASAFLSMFRIAPQWVRNRLCAKVDDVLIDPNDAGRQTAAAAWSFWEVGRQGSRNYLAVSQMILDLKPSLGQVENLTTSELLGTGSDRIFRFRPSPAADNFPMALLAIVAHELGHLMIARDAPENWTDCGNWKWPWRSWQNPHRRLRDPFLRARDLRRAPRRCQFPDRAGHPAIHPLRR